MRHVKNKDLNKSAVAAHFCSHKHKFEEEPKLLKHTSNRPLAELLIWEKIFIYKNKEVAINFDTPQFNDLFKLMDTDNGRQRRWCLFSLLAADDGDNISESTPA